MDIDAEIWKPIPSFDGYDASTWGRVRSWRSRGGRTGSRQVDEPRILKPKVDKDGYFEVSLYGGTSKKVSRKVHAIIASTFLGPRPEGLYVCHHDDNPQNNILANLRYDTPPANYHDSVRNGNAPLGEEIHTAKLTEDDVREIRRQYRYEIKDRKERRLLGLPSQTEMARRYGVSQPSISSLLRDDSWKHL